MALIVQNASGTVPEADAYVTVDQFKAYHDKRGNDYSAFTDPQIEQAIVRATDYLDERFTFIGERLNVDQTTEWPRLNAFDIDDDYVNGIPLAVMEATYEYAFIGLGNVDLNPTPTRDGTGQVVQSFSESVGPISESVRFTAGGRFELPKYPRADRKLVSRGLVERRGRMIRG